MKEIISPTPPQQSLTTPLATIAAFFLIPLLLTAAVLTWTTPLHLRMPSFTPSTSPQTNDDDKNARIVDPGDPLLLEACRTHRYTTEIVSLDPLLVYINGFVAREEAEGLIKLGEPDFTQSYIGRADGSTQKVSGRSSQSAPLDDDHPLVACILQRARSFLGASLPSSSPFSLPQLVRYHPTQRYDLHTDYWAQHQMTRDGSGRRYNRPYSFFVFLRANCTGGGTYFPSIELPQDTGVDARVRVHMSGEEDGRVGEWEDGVKWKRGERDGEEKGVVFRPIEGNALFWVNMGADGVGDGRAVHAGLAVGEGEKIGMNIWPRRFY